MLTCKEYTDLRKKELKAYIEEKGLHPKLVVIQVGDRPESNSYIRGKMRDCKEVGIECDVLKYPDHITQNHLCEQIAIHNAMDTVHGVIVQLPLPDHIDVKEVQKWISPMKDVDGFRDATCFEPCTPKGVRDFLVYIGYEFEGKDALVIGRSPIVGKPLADMLTDLDCTVTLAHSKTKALSNHINYADIVFTCIDKIEWFDKYNFPVSMGTDVIDIGLGASSDGKLHGNLEVELVEELKTKAPNYICISGTGGVGLLTRLALVENVIKACEMQRG